MEHAPPKAMFKGFMCFSGHNSLTVFDFGNMLLECVFLSGTTNCIAAQLLATPSGIIARCVSYQEISDPLEFLNLSNEIQHSLH